MGASAISLVHPSPFPPPQQSLRGAYIALFPASGSTVNDNLASELFHKVKKMVRSIRTHKAINGCFRINDNKQLLRLYLAPLPPAAHLARFDLAPGQSFWK
ncbi:hypothetical protein CDAR_618501 [Caerostris darwini]|uniref:Uncharacterized protein n=1 Tax=Caerostris darwini TaxID=1538125 RepID=A0AAV4SU30_9ARAC|nr:hypothetical protein CDAR_618501 [Caerostris darwini]